MLQERYEYRRVGSFWQYEFFSEGPKGRIRKLIVYKYLGTLEGHAYYNLGFGDYDPVLKKINDLTVSNNLDRDKVLATVAATATDFTMHYPGCRIVVKGSTAARTRLYQMQIAANYEMISEMFDIQGQTADLEWVPFTGGKNYRGFIFERNS